MKKFDCLIVGQGIAGILIAFHLLKNGKSFYVIDENTAENASKIAGAIINPFNLKTGKRLIVPDLNYEVAIRTYKELGHFLNTSVIEERALILFGEMKNNLFPELGNNEINNFKSFSNFKSLQKVKPIFHIKNEHLIQKWFCYLQEKQILRKEYFFQEHFTFSGNSVRYKDIQAKKVIFCEGASGIKNPFFPNLPFNKNRGNALILSIPNLSEDYIYQFEHRLIPLGNHLFWMGSNYQWQFEDLQPDLEWQKDCISELKSRLNIPFQLISHLVAERPTTAGQKIMMLQHEAYKNILFFNGLGTKGFTLGPYYAKEFVEKFFLL